MKSEEKTKNQDIKKEIECIEDGKILIDSEQFLKEFEERIEKSIEMKGGRKRIWNKNLII